MLLGIDRSWTLFLDRDGVLNKRLVGDYVTTPAQLQLLPDVPEALLVLAPLFGRVVIVTNQQGVGKGLMNLQDLEKVHQKLSQELGRAAKAIDGIYYCPNLEAEQAPCRKPDIGMAEEARKDFPEIDFSRSLMVGDSPSDMEFGRRAGMTTVFVSTDNKLMREHIDLIDFTVSDLFALAAILRTKNR